MTVSYRCFWPHLLLFPVNKLGLWCTDEGTWTCDEVISSTKYHSLAWQQLPPDIQKLYETLGETKESWEGDVPSPSDQYDWFDLSPTQREAAENLGYTEGKSFKL